MKNKKPVIGIIDRFKTKVDKTGDCWIWTASKYGSGYGTFWDGEKMTGAHRFSYQISKGKIPKGLVVMHSCDNRLCVNPNHLSIGTYSDNLNDMVSKGRQRKIETYKSGSKHCNSKFNDFEIIEIRNLYKTGRYSHRELARKYGVEKTTISYLLKRKTYKNVK